MYKLLRNKDVQTSVDKIDNTVTNNNLQLIKLPTLLIPITKIFSFEVTGHPQSDQEAFRPVMLHEN